MRRFWWMPLLVVGCQSAPPPPPPSQSAAPAPIEEAFATALLRRDFEMAYELTTKDEATVGSPQTLMAKVDVMYARTKLPNGQPWRPTKIKLAVKGEPPAPDDLDRIFSRQFTAAELEGLDYAMVPFAGDDDPPGFVPPILHVLMKNGKVAFFAFESPRYARR